MNTISYKFLQERILRYHPRFKRMMPHNFPSGENLRTILQKIYAVLSIYIKNKRDKKND